MDLHAVDPQYGKEESPSAYLRLSAHRIRSPTSLSHCLEFLHMPLPSVKLKKLECYNAACFYVRFPRTSRPVACSLAFTTAEAFRAFEMHFIAYLATGLRIFTKVGRDMMT